MLKKLSFKQKMRMIPSVMLFFSLLILLLLWINSLTIHKRNKKIGEGYCPAYILSRDMEEQLASIEMTLQQAVSTLEMDALEEADRSRNNFISMIDECMNNPVLDKDELEQHRQDFITYYDHARSLTQQMIKGNLQGSIYKELELMKERYRLLKKELSDARNRYENEMEAQFGSIQSSNTSSLIIMMVTIILSSILIGGTMFKISTGVTNNLTNMVGMMKNVAKGEADLTQRLIITTSDELGDLANWFNLFMEKLHAIISQVQLNMVQVSNAVSLISTTSSQMAAGSEEHNAQASEVSASVEEMTASIMQNSQNSSQTAKIAEDTGKQVQQGVETMQTTREGMNRIVESSAKLAEIVKTLTNRALQIGEIIQVIDKIADQTNLLALNAAVEAARAGEQGSGFAVVADEVRKLAERTAEATREISDTIEAIQKDTIDASESMMETKDAVESGQMATQQIETVLGEILNSVNMSVDMVQQIAAASEEQSAGAEEISSSVEAMNIVAKQTSEGVEHMSAVAQELNSQTETLRSLVEHFKLNDKNN